MAKTVIRGKDGGALAAPGDERRDQLKERTDALEEQAETLGVEAAAFDPEAYKIDNEIASVVNELEVSDAQPGFVYRWVWTGLSGIKIREALAERIPGYRGQGWHLVKGSGFKEGQEVIDEQGLRRVGDAVLMRASEQFVMAREMWNEKKTLLRLEGVTARLREMADKTHGRLKIHSTDIDPTNPVMQQALERGMARQMGVKAAADAMRTGTVPGVEPGAELRR
jgi:hypothetical protein